MRPLRHFALPAYAVAAPSVGVHAASGRRRGRAPALTVRNAGIAIAALCAVFTVNMVESGLRSSPALAGHGLSALPAGALGPVSATLGRDDPVYRVAERKGVLVARSASSL